MASTYKGLAGLARDTADASAAAAVRSPRDSGQRRVKVFQNIRNLPTVPRDSEAKVMVGDAQQHAQTLKDHLDKLKSKALGVRLQ